MSKHQDVYGNPNIHPIRWKSLVHLPRTGHPLQSPPDLQLMDRIGLARQCQQHACPAKRLEIRVTAHPPSRSELESRQSLDDYLRD